MKLLTVRPPWAQAIFVSPVALVETKGVENRQWYTSLRERIGIHAGLNVDRRAGVDMPGNAARGAVLGTVEITGCHEEGSQQCGWHECRENPWAQWSQPDQPPIWHWELEHPREFVTPIPAKGRLGLWEPGPSVAHLMLIADFIVPVIPDIEEPIAELEP